MKPLIMGILNVTPDSFSDGGQFLDAPLAVRAGRQMAADGADWIDVGGESTRPGSEAVSVDEELRRVVPVIEGLASSGLKVSVDTQKPEVARLALEAGAAMINDVNGLRDEKMFDVISDHRPSVCIMHMQGSPATMQHNPTYADVAQEVLDFLVAQAKRVQMLGVQKDRIYLDPGFGFGKTAEHNVQLMRSLHRFVGTGFPVLVGVSRKSWIGQISVGKGEPSLPVSEREEGTIAVQSYAQIVGASMIRTHNVAGAVRARNALDAILNGSDPPDRL